MSDDNKEVKKSVMAKPGTPAAKTEATIGAAAKALAKAAKDAEKVIAQVNETAALAEQLTEDIATKQAQLEVLTDQYVEKERQAKIDLGLVIQEKKGEAVDTFLKAIGREAVDTAEYAKLKADKTKLETEFNKAVEEETKGIRASESAKYTSQLSLNTAETKATNAVMAAELNAAKDKITFYAGEVEALRKQLNDEREARVKEAQARGNAQVTVNNGK